MGPQVIREVRPQEGEAVRRSRAQRAHGQNDARRQGTPRYVAGAGGATGEAQRTGRQNDGQGRAGTRGQGTHGGQTPGGRDHHGAKGHGKEKDKKEKDKKDAKEGKGGKGKGGPGGGGAPKDGGRGAGGGKEAGAPKKGGKKDGKGKGAKDGAGGDHEGGESAGGDEGTDFDFLALPAIPMARAGDIRQPVVEPPTPAILKAERSILSESGLAPKAHHDKVELAMEAVTRTANESQVDMVHRVEALAWDTRWEIEQLADQIPRVVEGGCALIDSRVDAAEKEVTSVYNVQAKRIADYQATADADLVANRDRAMAAITDELRSGSKVITEFSNAAAKAFEAKQKLAAAEIRAVPLTGKGTPLPVPDHGGARPREKKEEAKAPFTIAEAAAQIREKELAREGYRLETYERLKAQPVLTSWAESRQQLALDGARRSAEQINSRVNFNQFLIVALGLTAPVAEDTRTDKPGNNRDEKRENDENQVAQLTAKDRALAELARTFGRVKDFLKEQRKKLKDNLRKTGRKIEKSLRHQARTAEVGIATAASQMAPAYPEAVKKLEALVTPGHFLDSRVLVPELASAKESLLGLRLQHLQAARAQADETLKGVREGFEQQRKSIWESAQKSGESLEDPITRAAFDFELAADSFTGQLMRGTASAMGRARAYAERVAQRLLDDTKKIKKGVDGPLDESAANFLNGAIAGEVANYARMVGNTSKDWNETGGPFQTTQEGVRSDLSTRTKTVKDALPERSTALAVGLSILSPIGGGAYLYATRAKEDDVLKALGGVQWPGAGAIEDMFNGWGPPNTNFYYGNLRARIDDRMSDPQQRDALKLLSSNAGDRWEARREIAETSTAWFTGPSAATREEVMRGFSQEEATYAGPAAIEQHRQYLRSQLSGSELQISEAYLDRNAGRVLALRAEQKLAEARRKGDDAMVQFNDEMQQLARVELGGTYKNAFVSQGQIDALMGQMYVAHAELMDERQAAARALTGQVNTTERQQQGVAAQPNQAAPGQQPRPTDPRAIEAAARQRFLERMRTRVEILPGPMGTIRVVERPVDPTAMRAIEAAITKTPEEAWIARAAYEVRRAERDGRPSESTQTRLTRSLEDQELFQIERQYRETSDPTERASLRQQLDEARVRHDRKMARVAGLLEQDSPTGNRPDLTAPGGGTAYMTDRVGRAFSGVRHGTAYGREMIQGGRASLLTGILLATDKAGTNDDLLRSTYSGRSRAEIGEANHEYGRRYGGGDGALERMLGISKDSDFFSETSGDLAMELRRLARGEPKSDLDFAELAALQHEQQRVEGTGFIARRTMEGTAEQRELDSRKDAMARSILAAAGQPDGDPRQVFGSDGRVLEPFRTAAFDRNGRLKGGEGAAQARYQLRELTGGVRHAADAYQAEIDRQESLLTGLISALAILVTVVLLCIPGVNLVVAGVLTAVIAGAATMTVKYGMRGKRYGYEEAAVDVGMMAIEAATAGIGGGLGRGAAQGAKAAGILGKVGAGLNKTLGKFGGTVAREAIVGAIGGAARTAIQDETWQDGLGAGLQRVALSGVKGAAASAASAAVSTAVSTKLTKSLEGNLLDASKVGRMGRLGEALGPAGREMAASVLSQTLGAMSATATDIVIDVATGHYHGSLRDALLAIGESGLREMFSSTLRTGAELRNKARLQALRKAAQESGRPLSDADLRTLRLAAISAGEEHYGGTLDDQQARQAARARGEAGHDPVLARMKADVELARRALDGMPPELRAKLSGLDAQTLQGLRGLMESPTFGSPEQRLAMLRALHAAQVPFSREEFMGALEGGQRAIQKQQAETTALHKQVRTQLGAQLEGPARRYLKDLPLEGLDQLPPTELKRLAELIKSGHVDPEVAGQLYAAAKAKSPNLSEETFHRNLRQAVEAVAVGRQVERAATVKAREDTLGAFSEEGRAALADLSDASLRRVKKLIDGGEKGSNEIAREALYRAAAADSPGLDRPTFFKHLDAAVQGAATRRNDVRRAARQERYERLSEYPRNVRGPLSALPEEALFQLRLAQARGEEISPQLRQALHDAALRETPGVDLRRLNAAMDDAVKRPSTALVGAEGEALRKQLLAGIPEDQRVALADVPILVMKPAEFLAFTRSATGDAVTLIIDGRPVVVMKEGARPQVLREEGLHALQSKDPRWRERVGSLDEAKLARWNSLPLEEQLTLYRTKLEVEIDGQQRLIGSLQAELGSAPRAGRAALATQLLRAQATLENLGRRLAQVDGLSPIQKRAIETGVLDRAQAVPFLDQAPRLFSKDGRQVPPKKVILEPFAGPNMGSPLDLLQKNPGALVVATEATTMPSAEEVARLHAAGGAFVADNVSTRIPHSVVDEIKMRFPLPHEDGAEQYAFVQRMADLRRQFPDASEIELTMKVVEEGNLSRRPESLTAYAPYALERLKPGGELEVVWWDIRIKHELEGPTTHRFLDETTGKMYQLVEVSRGEALRGDVAPKSGYGLNLTDESVVNVVRYRKVEVEQARTGANGPEGSGLQKGAFSRRDFNPENAGGAVRPLDFSRVLFTTKAVDVVEAHVKRFEGGAGGAAELAMVARLRQIVAGTIEATDFDRAFYTHELRESVRYRRKGFRTGEPEGAAGYDLWNDAHTATLEDYRLYEKTPDGGRTLFHPDALAAESNTRTGARGPPPPVAWDAEVPLGIRSADAHDPNGGQGKCATWVWVMALRNAGWSGAVAADPARPVGKLVRELRDPHTGDPLPEFSGPPSQLLAQAHGLEPGAQIVITARTQSGSLHQMLAVVRADGSLDVMHSYAPTRVKQANGQDRIYYGEQADLAQFTGHKWWVLPKLPGPPPRAVVEVEPSAPLSLDAPVRRTMEHELKALGHDPEVMRHLTDAELFTAYGRAQSKLTEQRLDAFRETLPWTAKGELDALRTSGAMARQPVSETNLKARVQNALQTPIVVDSALGHGEVQVRYKRGLFGMVTGVEIRVGPGATLEDVLLHVPTLHAYKRYQGVAGAVRRLTDSVQRRLGRGAKIPGGSVAEEAWREVQKLPAIIEARQRRLSEGGLDTVSRVRLELEIEQLEAQLAGYARALGDSGKGRGYVAAKIDATPAWVEEVLARLVEENKLKSANPAIDADAHMLREILALVGKSDINKADAIGRILNYRGQGKKGADFNYVVVQKLLMIVEQKNIASWEDVNGIARQVGDVLKGKQGTHLDEWGSTVGQYLMNQWEDPTYSRVKLVARSVPAAAEAKYPSAVKLLAVAVDSDGTILHTWPENGERVQTGVGFQGSGAEFLQQWNSENGRRQIEERYRAHIAANGTVDGRTFRAGVHVVLVPVTRELPSGGELERLNVFE